MLPVEAFVTGIKIFDWAKSVFDIFYRSKVSLKPYIFNSLIFTVRRLPSLIAWFNFDPGHKRFYTGHIGD